MMYRKILSLIGIIGFSLVLTIWSVSSLAQSPETPPKDPFEVYQEKSARINQVYAKEYLSLARWCKTKRLFDQAGENFELVLKYDPENKQARKYLDKGPPKKARTPRNIEQLLKWYDQRLAALYKKLADKHYTLGVWCKKNNLTDKAGKEFDRAVELCFDHQKTRKELGQVKVKGFGWVDKETAVKLKKGLREYKGEWLPKDKVNKLCSNWEDAWEIKTEHYLIRTNNTYEQGYEIGQVVEDLYEMYFKVMGKILELKEPKGLMSIYYFKSEEDYKTEFQRIHGQPPASQTGVYTIDIDGAKNIKRVYSWGPRKNGGDEKDTMRHECTHQLNHILSGLSGSWLEQGWAMYFESVRRNKNGRLTIGDINHYHYGCWEAGGKKGGFRTTIKTHKIKELKRFLQLRENEMTGVEYEQGTALVRFFLDSRPGQRYKDRFLRYVRMCYTAPISPKTGLREIDSLKAFQECFPKVDLDELEKEFLAGWDK